MQKYILIAGFSVISFAGGGASGYFYSRKKLESQYADELQKETAAIERYYQMQYKAGEFETPETALKAKMAEKIEVDPEDVPSDQMDKENLENPEVVRRAGQALRDYQGRFKSTRDVSNEEIVKEQNVFSREAIQEKDESDEMVSNVKDPRIITENEFNDHCGYEQTSLYYYAGDGTLVDDDNTIIADGEIDDIVGKANLDVFARMSDDKNLIFVRNEKRQMEYEILRDHSAYGETVAGFTSGS